MSKSDTISLAADTVLSAKSPVPVSELGPHDGSLAGAFGVKVTFHNIDYMVVQDLGNGFGLAAQIGTMYPATLVLIPLTYT